ncbi:MAG: PAS domain-containing sensor histidine kinase [Dehalococcoides mccartyi]|uniref:histidine kinase n=1 Tax=Dehalococcoides mccartyi TaxID=61435 RepID=A0AB38ZBR5_9CHLR|nr:PAS domain-containing sensor histidine kinase [Dehalococcoides mccartyi]WRO08009.1 PAS domain-containing sensor histidine kinase [Dehalococcoides mccartyi]
MRISKLNTSPGSTAKRHQTQPVSRLNSLATKYKMTRRMINLNLYRQNKEQKSQKLNCQKLYRKYKTIFDLSSDPIVIAEVKGTGPHDRMIVEINEAAIKHFGYSRSELLMHDTSFLHPPEEVDALLSWVGTEMNKNHHVFFEAKHLRKDGNVLDVEIHATQIAIDNSPISIAVIRDISERKSLEKRAIKLHQAEQKFRIELESQIYQRTEFYKALVHELKTPLTPIVLNSEMLEDNLEGKHKKLADNIKLSSLELLARINELYDMAKGEVGTLQINRTWISLFDLINEIASVLSPSLNSKQLSLQLFFRPHLPPVYADQNRLKQVLVNLLNNAITFSLPKNKITMICGFNQKYVTIEIMDEGTGISEDDLHKLFKPYVLTKSDGLGLGLALSKKIIELHNGKIRVKSIKNTGSKFSIILPANNTD